MTLDEIRQAVRAWNAGDPEHRSIILLACDRGAAATQPQGDVLRIVDGDDENLTSSILTAIMNGGERLKNCMISALTIDAQKGLLKALGLDGDAATEAKPAESL